MSNHFPRMLVACVFICGCSPPNDVTSRHASVRIEVPINTSTMAREFTAIAVAYASENNYQLSGPAERPGRLGTDYIATFVHPSDMEISALTLSEKARFAFYCPLGSDKEGAERNLNIEVQALFEYFRERWKYNDEIEISAGRYQKIGGIEQKFHCLF